MKTIKLQILILALAVTCINANAQFGGLRRAVQRGVERAVEKKAEEKAGEAADKAIEKAEEQRARGEAEAAKALDKAAEKTEEMQKTQEEIDAKTANLPDEIPETGSSPYTPSESEFAFFAMKNGAVQTFVNKDAKGKITSQVRNTVKSITGSKNAFAVAYESEALNAKGKPADKDNPLIISYRIVVKDGIMYLDMKGMFGALDGLDNVQASGSAMKIPSNLSVGQSLEDASARVRIGFINCSAVTTEGKCLAIEDITVEAGTFSCYKISQKTTAAILGIKTEGTTITWYAKGIGAVKTENINTKGKLISTQELISNL